MPSFTFDQIPDLQGRVAIVTGGNNGIGEVAVRELANKGCHVYLFARNQQKAEAAMERMKVVHPSMKGEITFIHFDSSDNQSIKRSVEEFKSQQDRLDILVNNAGIMSAPYTLSKDGIEIQQATNAVGPALLTFLLLDVLVRTARKTVGQYSVRIIQTSSSAHWIYGTGPPKQSWASLEDVNQDLGSTWKRYGKSKVANILLALELTRIIPNENICNVSLNPGNVKTGLLDYDKMDPKEGFMRSVYTTLVPLILTTPDKGTISTLYAATSEDLNDVERYNGLYLETKAKHAKPSKHARNVEFAQTFVNFVKKVAKDSIDVDIDNLIEEAKKK